MYTHQIKCLKFIIDNFDKLGECEAVSFEDVVMFSCQGICDNISIRKSLFEVDFINLVDSWNNGVNGYYFPVDGEEEFRNINLYTNPKRLDFAKHIYEFLKQKQTEYFNIINETLLKGENYVQ